MSDKAPAADMTVERIQAILDGSPFIRFFGMRVAAIDPAAGKIVLAMELRPELERRLSERAALAGLTLEELLQQLAEREAANGAAPARCQHAGRFSGGTRYCRWSHARPAPTRSDPSSRA